MTTVGALSLSSKAMSSLLLPSMSSLEQPGADSDGWGGREGAAPGRGGGGEEGGGPQSSVPVGIQCRGLHGSVSTGLCSFAHFVMVGSGLQF